MAAKLSKSGYGTLSEIYQMPGDWVLRLIDYEKFVAEYESAVYNLNKQES